MKKMKNFKNLHVWQKSIELVKKVYENTSEFPSAEIYGLTSQVRRSAVSISSNIAEGAGRGGKEFNHFLNIAIGSCFELETQLIIALELKFTREKNFIEMNELMSEIQKMIFGLQKKVNS
jgi:four helix bundle protein